MDHSLSDFVSVKRGNRIAVISLSRPPGGHLDAPLRAALLETCRSEAASDAVDGLVLTSEGQGLDIDLPYGERMGPPAAPTLAELCAGLSELPKPIVAALRGRVADAGFELALACAARVVQIDASICLPSLAMGRLPTATSLYRLAARAGPAAGLQFLQSVTDVPVASRALAPLFAERVQGNAVGVAADCARSFIGEAPAALADPLRFQEEISAARDRHSPEAAAPEITAAIAGFEAALLLPEEAALAFITEQDKALSETPVCRAKTYLRSTKLAILRRPIGAPPESLTLVGSGPKPARLAVLALRAELPVTLIETEPGGLAHAEENIRHTLVNMARRGVTGAEQARTQFALLSRAEGFEALKDAPFVIEAGARSVDEIGSLAQRIRDAMGPGGTLLLTSGMRTGAGRLSHLLGEKTAGALFHPDRGLGECAEIAMRPEDLRRAAHRSTFVTALAQLGLPALLQEARDGLASLRLFTALCVAGEEAAARGADPLFVDMALPFRLKPFAAQNAEGLRAQIFRLSSLFGLENGAPQLNAALLKSGIDGKTHPATDSARGQLTAPAEAALRNWREAVAAQTGITAQAPSPDAETIRQIADDALFCAATALVRSGALPTPWEADHIAAATLGLTPAHGPPVFAACEAGLLQLRKRLEARLGPQGALRPAFFTPPDDLDMHIKEGRPYGRPGDVIIF